MTDARNYKIAYLIKDGDDQGKILAILQSFGASLAQENILKSSLLKLTYPIKKAESAYFGYLYFSAVSENINKISGEIKTIPGVLRFLITTELRHRDSTNYSVNQDKIRASSFIMDSSAVAGYPKAEQNKINELPTKPIQTIEQKESSKFIHFRDKRLTELSNKDLEEKLEEILG